MLAKWLRKWFGSVRLAMTLMVFISGLVVIALDMALKLHNSNQLYGCVISLAGLAAVFLWKDTDRPAGYNYNGIPYKYGEGEP
jgi:hypothetical protein